MPDNSERIFLRNSETGEFYKSPGAWVSNPDEATIFETREQALRRRLEINEAKLELLVLDENGRPRSGVRLWTDSSEFTSKWRR